MLWVMNVINKLMDKCSWKLSKMKECVFYLGMIALEIVVMAPLVIAGFYNHMSGDDWYNARLVHWLVMDNNISLTNIFTTIINALKIIYETWSFTYGGWPCFIMPSAFGDIYVNLHHIIIMLYVLSTLYIFLHSIFKKLFSTETKDNVLIFILFMTPAIQLMPSVFSGFYWFSGSFNNTFGFSLSLLCIAFINKAINSHEIISKLQWGLFIIALCWLAGTSYAAVLVIFCIMSMGILDIFAYSKRKRWEKVMYCIAYVIFISVCIWGMTAPGNAVRQAEVENIQAGYSVLKTIVYAIYAAIRMIYESINISVLLFLGGIIWVILPKLADLKNKFSNPIIASILFLLVLSTTFMPTLYAQGITGESRVRNIQYWYCLLYLLMLLIYWTGWLIRKYNMDRVLTWNTRWKNQVIFIVFIIGLFAMIKGEQEPASKMAYRELRSGVIQQFDRELTTREKIYTENYGKDVQVTALTNIPDLFDGYTDIREEKYWINSNIRDYYRLHRLYLFEK